MELALQIIFWLSTTLIFYVYFGYPAILSLLVVFRKQQETIREDITPTVTFVISAYNEEQVIREKIENTLSLEYPKEGLEIFVISDCSTDKTDSIVREYEQAGVRLFPQNARRGKTSGLNNTVPHAQGDIIIFSDANSIYQKDAIKKLVRNFFDKSVGYVTGEARYQKKWSTPSEKSESLYWKYEIFLKTMESKLGSMVGGDGAIYAIRKELFEPLRISDISDFVNPLQIIAKNYRGLYDRKAICSEETVESLAQEFRRKKRIVNRSWNGLFRVKEVLNPFQVGIFAFKIVSHKLLRWLIPFFLSSLFISNLMLAATNILFYRVSLEAQLLFYALACIGGLKKGQCSVVFYLPYYFCLVNLASMMGILECFSGHVVTVWAPERAKVTPETKLPDDRKSFNKRSLLRIMFISISVPVLFLFSGKILSNSYLLAGLFWTSFFLISYTYFGYPFVLMVITTFKRESVRKRAIYPEVTLLIPAYNEEADIENKLDNSLSLNYPDNKLNIIVVSDGSTDRTNDMVEKYIKNGVKFCPYSPRTGKISVINKSMTEIQSEVVVFSDANAIYHPDAIRNLVRNFSDASVGAVSGDATFVNDKSSICKAVKLYYKYERFIQSKETRFYSMVGADGAIYAIRRNLFEPLSNDVILDDLVISMEIARKGYRIVYEDKAKAYEAPPSTLREEFNRKIRLIAGAVQAFKQRKGQPGWKHKRLAFSYVSHKVLRWMVPILGFLLFFTNALLVGPVFYNVAFAAQILIFIFAILGYTIKTPIFNIPFYLIFNNLAMLIGLYRGTFDKQPVKWAKSQRNKLNLAGREINSTLETSKAFRISERAK